MHLASHCPSCKSTISFPNACPRLTSPNTAKYKNLYHYPEITLSTASENHEIQVNPTIHHQDRMEDPSEEWEIENENGSSSFQEENIKTSTVGWILDKSICLGKKVVITGIVISSAPLVLPPLVVISAIGFAFSVPFGFIYASYACTEKLMSQLLPDPAPSLMWNEGEQIEEEVGNASLVKGDVVAMEEDEQEPEEEHAEEVGNASLVKGGVVAMEEDEREQEEEHVEEVGNAFLVKGDVVATEEEEREQEEEHVEEVGNASLVKGDVVAMEEETREQEEDMKDGIEFVEDGSRENGNDDAKVRETIKDDQEKVVSTDETLKERGYEEDESLERMDDIEIEELDKDREKEPLLECKDEKRIGVADNEEDRKFEGENAESLESIGGVGSVRADAKISVCSEVQPDNFVDNEDEKNVGSRKEEDMSKDTNDDKNVEIRKEEDMLGDKNVKLDKDVPEMKGREEREKEPLLECIKEPRRVSENIEDRKFEGQNTESIGNTGDEHSAREDAKYSVHRLEVEPDFFAENEDENNVGSRKREDMSVDKNAKLDKVVRETKEREKVKGGQTISEGKSIAVETKGKMDKGVPEMKGSEKVKGGQTDSKGKSSALETEGKLDKDVPETKGREKIKGGQTISKGKSSAVEIEGRGKRKIFKTQIISGNRKGTATRRDEKHETSLGKVEKPKVETKNLYEKEDLNMVQDTKGKYEETGEEMNVEVIKEHTPKDGSNSVPDDIKQDGEMVEGILLEKGDADHSKISMASRKSTDTENELINGKHDILQGESSKDGAGSVVYSDPGCEKSDENIISQEVSSSVNAEAEAASPNSGLFSLTRCNEPEDESKDSVDDVALSEVTELKHLVETKSKGNGNVCEADGALISDEGLPSGEKVWTQIDAIKAIIGYREPRFASIYDEVKALYLFTGVEPPLHSSFEESSGVAEVYENLRFLMSVIGVK